MLKLQTPVTIAPSEVHISLEDKIMVLGSCFADNIGGKMLECGFDACVNPFGTLYNPVSIVNALRRLESAAPFSMADCVEMGAGAGLVCSFSHHTSFARKTADEFLDNANEALKSASAFWRESNIVIVTLGTAWCFKHCPENEVVSNCLKRPASEFSRERLTIGETTVLLQKMVSAFPKKRFIFTVSPVRHLADGANGNQVSKSTLLLAVDTLVSEGKAIYFPAYEIMMDELRDYRFYAEDMVHPSKLAVECIWERFCDFAVPQSDRPRMIENEKAFRRSQHRNMH